jgi:hypothetical protein
MEVWLEFTWVESYEITLDGVAQYESTSDGFVNIAINCCLSLGCEARNHFIQAVGQNNCAHTHSQEFFPWQATLVCCANGIYISQGNGMPEILATYPRIETFSWALTQRLQLLLDLPAILGTTWYSLRMFWVLNGMYIFHLFSDEGVR